MFVDTVVSVKTDSLDAPSVSSEVSLWYDRDRSNRITGLTHLLQSESLKLRRNFLLLDDWKKKKLSVEEGKNVCLLWWFYYSRIKEVESQGENVTLELWCTVSRYSFQDNAHHVSLRQTVPELRPKID
jgi:hypothetical protein